MALTPPTDEHVAQAARSLGISLSNEDVREVRDEIADLTETLRVLDEVPDLLPEVRWPRTPGHHPSPEENPHGAWYVRTDVRGADQGPLASKRVALKDNVLLAGVPMMAGASTLRGYVPDVDATVVTRILDAAGTIAGKTHCEYFSYSASSHTGAGGLVHNPHRRGRSAGGSSSGSAAAVAAGDVPMAIGADQGGSIRVPASWCGIVGMKPTHGLVPYTGIMPVDPTLDHVGPMTATVTDNALLLQVLAGADGLDPRQAAPTVGDYVPAVQSGVAGLRIGLLREGFGRPGAQPEVDEAVRAAGMRLQEAGADVVEVSVPAHDRSIAVWAPVVIEGSTQIAMMGNATGYGIGGLHTTSLQAAHAAWRSRADQLSEPLKTGLITGLWLASAHHGHYYAKAQNLGRWLRSAYDAALAEVDLLLLPTVPFVAPELPVERTRAAMSQPGFTPVVNTAAFNITGHPALSVPVGRHDGLPIGAMLVGRHWEEATAYRAAGVLERT